MEYNFSFIDLRVLESHFKLNVDFDPKKSKSIRITTNVDIQYKKHKKIVRVFIHVNSDKKRQPFIFDVAVMGIFDFVKMPSKKVLDKIIHINCASIIFPYVRETIADMTRRAGIPPFHMDPLNFVAMYENLISSKKKKVSNKSEKK